MKGWPLNELARTYGFHLREVQPCLSVLYIDTSIGKLAVKRTKLQAEELDLEFRICEHLVKQGFKRLARIIPTNSGRGFAEVGDQRFLITAWIEATQSNPFNLLEMELATRTMAQFHRLACGYFGPVCWQKRRLYGVWPQRFSYRLGHILSFRSRVMARGAADEFDELFLTHADRSIIQAQNAIQRLRRGAYYTLANKARKLGTICHHDYAYHNVLINAAQQVWLVDFDYCLLDMPLHDLGSIILRLLKSSNWSLELAERILLIYHEEKNLEPGSLEALLSFMEYPQDFWQLAWAKYAEVNMHKPENLLLRLRRLEDSLEARENFLAGFTELSGSGKFLPGRDSQ